MMFTDDIVLVDEHREGLYVKIEVSRETLESKEFIISKKKTQYMKEFQPKVKEK